MVSQNLKELLLKRNEDSDLNFTKLVEMLEGSEFEFIGCILRGTMGLATYNKAYFDMNRIIEGDNQLIFFVILHEYCHVKKINRIGKEEMISQLAEDDFDVFFNHVIEEEILADRFGSLYYYYFNKRLYPKYRTQCLEDQMQKDKYVDKIIDIHGQIKDEESYDKLMNHFILS